MDFSILDALSPGGLRNLEFEIQTRIRRRQARSENGSPSRPYLWQRDQPQIEPNQFQSIIHDGNFEGRSPCWQDNSEAIYQSQVQPSSRDITSVLSGHNPDFWTNWDIEPLGGGRDLVSAQPYVGTTPAQPQQTWANGSAPTSSFSRVDSLAPENQPLSTSGLVGCEEVPQLLFTGGTPGALLNTYRPFRVENDLTGQYGTANASTSASSQPQGFMPEIFQDFQTEATYNQSLIGRLPEPNDLEPAPNWMNSMTSGDLVGRNMRSPQPDAGRYTLHSNQTFNFNENEWPMTFGLTVPGTDTTKAQMAPKIPGSPATAQTKKTMPDETANLVVTKTASKKKKGRRGFPNMAQKENTNRVKENGGACARCEKQKINCELDPANPKGACLTCAGLTTTLDGQLECFRGKIMDVVLFRNNVDPDYRRPDFSRSFRIGKGILTPIKDFDAEGKYVELTRGLGLTMRLHVVKAKILYLEDIPASRQFIYDCPWALADFPKAVKDFTKFLWGSIEKEIANKIRPTEKPLAFIIFQKTWELATRVEGRSLLLQKALLVWSGSRQIEGGWHFHGSETLGQQTNKEGKVPLTVAPILDSQISSIIVRHHLQEAKILALEEIHKLQTKSRKIRSRRMFELFLAYFILLHNCECIMKHQRNWAIHNNSPFRYTPKMMGLVKEVLHTVQTILYMRSDIRGQFPFSPEWNPNSTGRAKIVEFTREEAEFFKEVGKKIEGKEEYFNRLSQNWENYDRDYSFTGQLFVRDGRPFGQTWLAMPHMPERPPAPMYGPASPADPTHQLLNPPTINI